VTVRGEAVIRAEPDEAVLWVTLSALDAAPGPALADVSARTGGLMALLDELGVARGDRSTSGITVHEDFDHTSEGRRSLGHRASATVSVRMSDTELIGRLVSQATSDLEARIDGPRWQIARDNPVHLEAAREAAADAQRKAQAYAEGVGVRLGRLLRLTEPDGGGPMIRAASTRAMAVDHMDVEAGELEVSASIRATFALDLDAPDST